MTIDLDSLLTVSVYSGSSGTFEGIGTMPTSITSGIDFKYQMTYLGGGTVKVCKALIKWS